MTVVKMLLPVEKYILKSPFLMTPEFIVVHNTANDSSARNEIKYMISNNESTSFHYAIDDKEIVQGLLDSRNGFHAGDGRLGVGNTKGLAIEICYSKSGGERFLKAEKLASKFIALKLKEYGWDISKVKTHQMFSGKYCPHRTLDLGWDRFLKMVEKELIEINRPNEDALSKWAIDAHSFVVKYNISDGLHPKRLVSREEVWTMLYRLFNQITKQ